MLNQRGIVILPDILVNAGGVIVSYFEWVQNLENQQWDIDKVERNLEKRMVRAVDRVLAQWKALQSQAEARSPTLRDAALVAAIRTVSTVILQRDIWL